MSNEQLQQKIDDARVEGWTLDRERGNQSAVMVKRSFGRLGAHALVFLLFGWWTIGLANLLYATYVYFGKADKKVIRT